MHWIRVLVLMYFMLWIEMRYDFFYMFASRACDTDILQETEKCSAIRVTLFELKDCVVIFKIKCRQYIHSLKTISVKAL